ncbi:hypothetical protein SAMN03159423_4864 [Bradyrhizobium sp. NFR13]|uniref:hypothetical protein n=1 Tax=Bradyrhizobium sp. NFR13 TaxID=1566285 RepID=UPI0008EE013C|nr:hypothetical protein [Bradyrhizobium sp. NFR13]SFM00548.1 hypothetical protein SAMN03159423_4864 [Bradyrhizobium sp. NFR13]
MPDWSGETAIVVASGPSAVDAPLSTAVGKARFIAVNDSWLLCPWADALYACDGAWWRKYRGVPEFKGLKLTYEAAAARQFTLTRVAIDRGNNAILTGGDVVGDAGNSGFQALNLAINWGVKRILLVGYDMTLDRGEHWHGLHPAGMNNPRQSNIRKWLSADWSTPAGVEVINCNPESALSAYPKMKFEEAYA